jgi:hypothetical protein
VTLRARWVTLRARWVTLRARWVTLRARWVTLRARWVTLGAHLLVPVRGDDVQQDLLLPLRALHVRAHGREQPHLRESNVCVCELLASLSGGCWASGRADTVCRGTARPRRCHSTLSLSLSLSRFAQHSVRLESRGVRPGRILSKQLSRRERQGFHQRRWRAAQRHHHPTGRERMRSLTLQTLQRTNLLGSAFEQPGEPARQWRRCAHGPFHSARPRRRS